MPAAATFTDHTLSFVIAGIVLVLLVVGICICWSHPRKSYAFLLGFLRYFYDRCCCRFDCASQLDLETAIERYHEHPPLPRDDFLQQTTRNKFINSILAHFTTELPEYFFSILPTGSLREEVGKLLPSTAIVATDFDLMLIPDAITVGEPGGHHTFMVAVNDEVPEGFVWISLQYSQLVHWSKLTVPRHVDDKVQHFISIHKVHHVLTQALSSLNLSTLDPNVQKISTETNGPALTVKFGKAVDPEPLGKCISALCKPCIKCCYQSSTEITEFYCDFTLALHHPQWPAKAQGTSRRGGGSCSVEGWGGG